MCRPFPPYPAPPLPVASLEAYLSLASVSRSCLHHALDPLKHRAFLAVLKAQQHDLSLPFPLPRVAQALAPLLPPGVAGLSRGALICLRDTLRLQAVTAWRVAGEMLLARVGDRLAALPDEGEWPVEAAVWSSASRRATCAWR
jgi:hypothetical protein